MPRHSSFSPKVRERAIRMVQEQTSAHESQWPAIRSAAEKVGCHPETLRNWARAQERDTGQRPGPTTADCPRLTDLERAHHPSRARLQHLHYFIFATDRQTCAITADCHCVHSTRSLVLQLHA